MLYWNPLKDTKFVLPRLCLMYSQDTSLAPTCTMSDDRFTMATQEQWGGESEKRCVKALERRWIQQGNVTHWLTELPSLLCWKNAIMFHPLSRRHVISWYKGTSLRSTQLCFDCNMRMQLTFSWSIYTVSAREADNVAKHHMKTGPTSYPCCHGGII